MIFIFYVFFFVPIAAVLLWLFAIRPYCRRNGRGYTPGANIGVTFWIDWQEAKEISRTKGDEGMIRICRVVLWLHITAAAISVYAFLRGWAE